MASKASWIHKHYTVPADGGGRTKKVKCNLCGKLIGRGEQSSTSPLIKHLSGQHPDAFARGNRTPQQLDEQEVVEIQVSEPENKPQNPLVDGEMDNFIDGEDPWGIASERTHQQANSLLVAWIVTEGLPLSTVYCPEFLAFINELEPRYKLPSRACLADMVKVERKKRAMNKENTRALK